MSITHTGASEYSSPVVVGGGIEGGLGKLPPIVLPLLPEDPPPAALYTIVGFRYEVPPCGPPPPAGNAC